MTRPKLTPSVPWQNNIMYVCMCLQPPCAWEGQHGDLLYWMSTDPTGKSSKAQSFLCIVMAMLTFFDMCSQERTHNLELPNIACAIGAY